MPHSPHKDHLKDHLLDDIKHTVDTTIPELNDLKDKAHPRLDYAMFLLRNIFVLAAAVLFLLSFFLPNILGTLRGIAYFCGAVAYLFECMALTDCFRTKVEPHEMFMVYCFGPLYLLMGLGYLLQG